MNDKPLVRHGPTLSLRLLLGCLLLRQHDMIIDTMQQSEGLLLYLTVGIPGRSSPSPAPAIRKFGVRVRNETSPNEYSSVGTAVCHQLSQGAYN